MPDDSHEVGKALAYLVKRMEMFCGTSGSDVLMYKRNNRVGIPLRMSAVEVLKAQARHYPVHRHLYPEDHQGVLDADLDDTLAESDMTTSACSGFLAALSSPQ